MNASRKGCGEAAPDEALQRAAEALTSPMPFNLMKSRWTSGATAPCPRMLFLMNAGANFDRGHGRHQAIVKGVRKPTQEGAAQFSMHGWADFWKLSQQLNDGFHVSEELIAKPISWTRISGVGRRDIIFGQGGEPYPLTSVRNQDWNVRVARRR